MDSGTLNKLGLSTFVALDVETTGFSPAVDHIIEFGATRFVDGVPEEKMDQLILPPVPIPNHITELTGITNADVEGQPTIEEIMPKIFEFCGDYPLVAHNAPFDMGFLRAAAAKAESKSGGSVTKSAPYFSNKVFDTLIYARKYLPNLNNHKLPTIAVALQLDEGDAHRASADAERAGFALLKILDLV